MKNLNVEQWKEIADLAKKINQDTNRLIITASNGMGSKRVDSLSRSSRHLNKFRSDAENLMFEKGIIDKNIFYGNQSVEE
jgi:hypothetical protein